MTRRKKKHLSLFLYRAQNLPSLLFLSTNITNIKTCTIFFRFQAYLYDIRGNTFCHRLTGHTDVVSEVAFHPAQPQVLKEPCTLRYTIDTFCMSDIAVSLHYAFGY